MGLIRAGGLWRKEFKSGEGFSISLDAAVLEDALNADKDAKRINLMAFDNSEAVEKNEKAPDYSVMMGDGQDDGYRGGRGGGGGRGGRSALPSEPVRQRNHGPEPKDSDVDPFGDPDPGGKSDNGSKTTVRVETRDRPRTSGREGASGNRRSTPAPTRGRGRR